MIEIKKAKIEIKKAKTILKEVEPILKEKFNVKRIGIFGSYIKRDHSVYLDDIAEAIKKIGEYTKGLSFDKFSKNSQAILTLSKAAFDSYLFY